ncbi:MAG: chemotaxis protein CheW [Nitrospirota bacterium]|nr:chemotaxis protein CheW [Nitrospirota bacterium]
MDLDELKKLQGQLLNVGEEERAVEAKTAEMVTFQVLVFELGHERYGLRIADIQEVVKSAKVFPVPSTPSYINGVINLRGNIVCVVNPVIKMGGSEATQQQENRIIVVKYGNSSVGILVDRIIDVVDISETDVHPLPPEHVSPCIEGDIRRDGDSIRLLRPAEVLRRD